MAPETTVELKTKDHTGYTSVVPGAMITNDHRSQAFTEIMKGVFDALAEHGV